MGTDSGGAGGGSGEQDAASNDVNYGICSMGGTTTLVRIDRVATTCTFAVLTPAQPSCPSGLAIGEWCVVTAGISRDVAACDVFQIPASAVAAASVAGTFATYVDDPAGVGGVAVGLADFNLTFTFPATADAPTPEQLIGTKCIVACTRPTSACGT